MSAVEYVLADLRQSIESGMIRVNERLPSETALAARYEVSRAVIREVLRSCESAGLTVTRPGSGTFVVTDHPVEMVFAGYSPMHLMEARPGIEVPAAGLAALRRSEAQLASLQRLLDEMEHEQDEAAWTRLDSQFHLVVAEASGNPVFAAVLASIAGALRSQSETLNVQLNRRSASQTEHRSVVSAIARRSALEAEDAMRFHLDQVHEALATLLTADRASLE
jgi:DNA-binding FadR family transcriptional regulator